MKKDTGKKGFPGVFWSANFLELFERWAYYGIFNLLALYLTGSHESGALGFTQVEKGLIMGIVNAILYFLPIITGAVADKFGYKRVLIIAFIILSSGYYLMGQVSSFSAVFLTFFYVAIGAALFKPIISATIAKSTTDKNSSIGFGIFYMIINVGGLVGPYVGSELREISWNYVFIMSSGAILLNLVLCIIFYREPDRDMVREKEPLFRSISITLHNILSALKDLRFLIFLLIVTGAWMVFWQLFYSLPVFIDQWNDSTSLYNFLHRYLPGVAEAIGTREGTILPEKLITLDAFFIVLFQVLISALVKRFRALGTMITGIVINSFGIALAFSTMDPFILVLSIFVFGLGEMSFSPKILEYIAHIAPRNKAALYMGAQFVPIALGNFAAGFLSGNIYDRVANKPTLLEKFAISQGYPGDPQNMKEFASWLHVSVPELNETLWNTYHPMRFGHILLIIGLITALLLTIYNWFLKKDRALSPG